jgi:hypothetical protein
MTIVDVEIGAGFFCSLFVAVQQSFVSGARPQATILIHVTDRLFALPGLIDEECQEVASSAVAAWERGGREG